MGDSHEMRVTVGSQTVISQFSFSTINFSIFILLSHFPNHSHNIEKGIGSISDSTLVQQDDLKKALVGWCGGVQWKLLYRGSRDGFSAQNFHSKCDYKGPTVTVIKSTTGHLFGGYNADSWDSTSGWKTNPQCFIFTLTNPHGYPPTKFSYNHGNSSFCRSGYGPVFGGRSGCDIVVHENGNAATNYTNFPYSYNDTLGKGKETFTGECNFTVSEIEVFGK